MANGADLRQNPLPGTSGGPANPSPAHASLAVTASYHFGMTEFCSVAQHMCDTSDRECLPWPISSGELPGDMSLGAAAPLRSRRSDPLCSVLLGDDFVGRGPQPLLALRVSFVLKDRRTQPVTDRTTIPKPSPVASVLSSR